MARTRKPTDSIPAYCGRIPAGWTYLGLYGGRNGRAKPHYRTAPGVMSPGTYRDLLDAWDEAERRRFRGEGREPFRVEWEFGRFDRYRVPETPDFTVDMSVD